MPYLSWETWNDLNICKQMLIRLNAMELRVIKDYHPGRCCGRNTKMVRSIYLGRYAGVEVCDSCVEIEQEFLDVLNNLPPEPDRNVIDIVSRVPQRSKASVGRHSKVTKQIEKMLETRADKEARKLRLIREELEKHGQGRLF